MKNILRNTLILGSILFVIFYIMDAVFTSIYKKGDFYKTQWLSHIKNEHYDFAILGTSRSYTGIDVGVIDNTLHKKGINLSIDGSTTSTHALVLELFSQNGNTVDRVFLQVDSWQINLEEASTFSYPRFFPYYDNDLVYNHYKELGFKFRCYKYIPFLRYAEFNTNWGLHLLVNSITRTKPHPFDEYGTFQYPNYNFTGDRKPMAYTFDTSQPTKYLDRMIEHCKKNNIQLICFTAPYAYVTNGPEYNQNISEFKAYLKNKGVDYFNYGDMLNQKFELFVDQTHLNKNGVKVFTDKMIELVGSSKASSLD